MVSFYAGFLREEGGVAEPEAAVPDPGHSSHEAASLGQDETEKADTRGYETSNLR